MAKVMVNLIEIIDNTSYPMVIKCELNDCKGTKHYFIDKAPVICECEKYTNESLCLTPGCTGAIRCNIAEEKEKTYIIDTEFPDHVESLNGDYRFEVWKEQIRL